RPVTQSRKGPRLYRGAADFRMGKHSEYLTKPFDLLIQQRCYRRYRIIAEGESGAAGHQHHLHIVIRYQGRYQRTQLVGIVLDDLFADQCVPRLFYSLHQVVSRLVGLLRARIGNGDDCNMEGGGLVDLGTHAVKLLAKRLITLDKTLEKIGAMLN